MVAHDDDALPGVPWLSRVIRTGLGLLSTLSEPVLIASIIVMIASDLTGGSLLRDIPWLNNAQAWGQAIGIDGQMVALAVSARIAFRNKQRLAGCFMTLIVALLGLVTFIGVGLANQQTVFGKNVVTALNDLGISEQGWSWLRAGILTVVAITGAYMLYIPRKALTDAQVAHDIKQKELQAQLAAADANLAKAKAVARIKAGQGAFAALMGREEAPADDELDESDQPVEQETEADQTDELAARRNAPRRRPSRRKPVRKNPTAEECQARIRAALVANIEAGNREISRATGLSTSTVARYKEGIKAEILAERAS